MNITPSEKIVYFVRHGQSRENAHSSVFPSPDSPLTAVGKRQSKLIAERITKISFETLIVSPFTRAKETAEAITKATGKKPEYSDLFIERLWPTRVAGKLRDDRVAKKLFKQWEQSLFIPGSKVEDGENFDDLMARASQALNFLKNRSEKEILVVTHGFFLRTIIFRVISGDSPTPQAYKNFQTRVSMENTGLSALKYGETLDELAWRLWIYNDHAHLG